MSSHDVLPREIAASVNAELRPGERIAWIGQPVPGLYARRSIAIFLFGILWTAFSLFWTVWMTKTTWAMSVPAVISIVFLLFGLAFLFVGVAILSYPYWVRLEALHTAYVITDQRALVVSPEGWRSFKALSFEPERLDNVDCVTRGNGSGDIVFERERTVIDGDWTYFDVGFLAVRNVEEAETHLKTLIAKAQILQTPPTVDGPHDEPAPNTPDC